MSKRQSSPFDLLFGQSLSRRSLVGGAGALAASAALGGTVAPAAYARQAQSFSGKLRIEAHDYTPSENMNKSDTNPIPHDALKRAADKYIEAHPDVEIEFVRVPQGTDSRVWVVTQLTGGIAPDIVWTQSFDTNRDVGKDWWVNLNPYMEKPNPYVAAGAPGSAKWVDQFFEAPTAAKYAPNGELYVVPYDLVTTFFFYNKGIFEKAQVEVPTTYDELITTLSKIKDSGVPAYNGMQWSRPQLGEMCIGGWKSQIEATGAAGAYTIKDITLAILAGVFDATKPEYKDWLRLMKDSVPYWADQWALATAKWDQQFTQGKLGIYEDGSWRFGLLKANDQINFEWGSFFMPKLQKGSGPGMSEYATGEAAPAIGGATANQFGITNTATKNGTVELAVDFLQFITAPEWADQIIGELGEFLPNIKGVEVNADLKGPLEAVSSGVGEAAMIAYGDKIEAEAGKKIDDTTNKYLLGKADLDKTAEDIQKLLMDQAQKAKDANGW